VLPESRAAAANLPLSPATRADGGVVQRVDPLEDDGWDARLTACPSPSFFHGAAWARVLHDTYGFNAVYFTLSHNPAVPRASLLANEKPASPAHRQAPRHAQGLELVETARGPEPVERASRLPHHPLEFYALLPVMEVNSWLTGRRGVSLPFTDECAPLCADADSFRRLFREALEYARIRAWNYLECRGGKPWFGDAPASTSFYGHRLDLDADETALWARVDGAVRRAVRKAEHSGLTVEFSQDLDAVRIFFGLLCRTRKRHGLPVQPFRFFESIHRHVLSQDQGWVVLARHGEVPVAGAVFFHFGKTAIYKFGASNETFQHLRANNLVMWEAIKWYARRGFGVLDFGRTSLENEGLRRFKLGWGTQERSIDYFRHDRRKAGFVTARDESSGWHNHVFRLLPVSLSRLIGVAFYRHVA
jgi:hypothetical protein